MSLNSRGHGRTRDQGPVVEQRDPLVRDRDDDLERALRGILGPCVPGRLGICLPVVVVPVFERSVVAWPETVPGPKRKLGVCDPCREHENGDCHGYRAGRSDVDASGKKCRHEALTALIGRFRAPQCWQFPRGHRPVLSARFGRFETNREKPASFARKRASASFRSRATALRKYRYRPAPTRVNPMGCRDCLAGRFQVLDRDSVVPKPASATPAMISKALACLRTSIFFRQSDARTNIRADLTASRHCIFASLAPSISRSTRASRRKRRERRREFCFLIQYLLQ